MVVTFKSILETSIVPGFTIAAALIWKDVIVNGLQRIWPTDGQLLSQVVAALVATVLVVVAVYLLLGTEEEAEKMLRRLRKKGEAKK